MDKQTEKNIIDDLARLVQIDSSESAAKNGMPFGEGVDKCLKVFLSTAEKMGLTTKDYDGYAGEVALPANIKLKAGEKRESIAILVHLDVVPAGDGWSVPPFSGEVRDGKMYGRGTTDDKGAAVVCLHILKKLLDDNAPIYKDIKLIAGCDEESGQLCMKHYKKHAVMPDVGFSPDADFPVINCEKTILQLKLSIPADTAFSKLVKETSSGDRPNVVPEKASALLADGTEIKFKGKAAHAMVAGEGNNAIFKLVRDLRKRLGAEKSAAIDFLADCLCDTDGTGLGIKAKDEKSGALTINFASLKKIKDKLEIVLDLRCPLCVDHKDVIAALEDKMPEGGKAEILHHQPALFVSENSPLIKTLINSYEKVTGKKGKCIISGGGTYARQLKCGVAFGPAEHNADNNIHSFDEFVEIKQLAVMYDIYYDAILNLAQ